MAPSNDQIDKSRNEALEKLSRLPEAEQLAVLDKLVAGRIKKSYIKYFEPWKPDQEIAVKAFTAEKKIFGLLGGNRSGKTILGAFISVAWCLGKKYFEGEPAWEWIKNLPIPDGPVNVWIVGVDFGTLKDVLWHEKLRYGKSHPPFLPDDSSIVRKISDGDFQVFFQNGSILTGKSAEAGRDKFQGASVDLIWIDEECEKDVFDECYQRTVDCAGKILLTQTPLVDINSGIRTPWVFDLYEEWLAGDKDLMFCQLSTLNSPFVPEEEKQRLIEKWTGDPEEGARLYGQFVRRSGLVYPLWDKIRHIVRPFDIPPNWIRIVSIDPAATGITAALWIAVNDKGDYFGYKEYYERERTVSEHAKSILMRCAGEVVDYWLLDPTWGGQRNAENHKNGAQLYREAGIPVRLPEVGNDFGMHLSREYINAVVTPGSRHPRFFIFANSLPNFEHEITHYSWDFYAKGEQKGLSKDKPRKRHDHLLNAFQYATCLRVKARRGSNVEIASATNEYREFFETNDHISRSEKQNNRSYT